MNLDNGYALGDPTRNYGAFVWIESPTMGRPMPTLIFTPKSYEESVGMRYSCGYILHGVNSQPLDESGLRSLYHPNVGLQEIADLYQCILVCPMVGCSYYIDSPLEPKNRFSTFVGKDLPAGIDRLYRTQARREGRFFMGFSMGGHGSITLLSRFSESFVGAASRGGVLDLSTGPKDLYWDEGSVPKILGSYWDNQKAYHIHSAINLINHVRDLRPLHLVIDVGLEDFLLACNRRFRQHLLSMGVPHLYTETPGGHSIDRLAFRRMMAGLDSLGAIAEVVADS